MELIKDIKLIHEDFRVKHGLIKFETNFLESEINQLDDYAVVGLCMLTLF